VNFYLLILNILVKFKKMKNLVYISLLITQVFFAQTGIENGNTLYKQGNYQEAIDVYETIAFRSQKQSPELYFNLANCYYKLNKVAPTIYNYDFKVYGFCFGCINLLEFIRYLLILVSCCYIILLLFFFILFIYKF
jgi:tetratricopeptide (TPR) repeat protein